ncbi:acyl-CoA dehydrogenase family protein [Sphingomonas olei]|uniref:Acyl-CoA dehydrogenase n=1 Tax=Sphingomonas olei TaxID=1886787 RepID=A0ABY2QEH2_9SPHN|nr:acyl-CoA dehydrogenase family protein [Sphingomonas olei]THG37838.1 acyl-CoA dehydrogenase [Sphingomonas olei]
MSLLYDDGQLAIASESRRVLEAKVSLEAQLPLLETQGAYDTAFWAIAREQGWTALAMPERHGGIDLGLVELGLVALQAGRSLSGAPFVTTSYGAAAALLAHDHDPAIAEWLRRLASGAAIGAVAFAERGATLPLSSAVRFSGGRLSGTKPAVCAGLHADLAVVLACGDHGPALVLAPLEGVTREAFDTFDNSRGTAHLLFADTPATSLAHGDAAIATAMKVLAEQAVIVAHEQTGGAERLMELARDHANTRHAFGSPIGAFQSVKHRIAELYGLVELARASALHAATRVGQADFLKAAAAARISATEAYDTAARDCIQIHGGIGVTWEGALHLHMRRARSLAIEQGNSLFWEDVLVNEMTKAAA